ncbi:hypothetical protein [Burkholderia diffusa]|nr:hypothetical protein [Burkholderia diffusa]
MSQTARDLLELRRECPSSGELRRIAMNLIAPGVRPMHAGC